MPSVKSGRVRPAGSRTSRRSILRLGLAGTAGAVWALVVGLDPRSGRGRTVSAQPVMTGRRARCSSCGVSVETRAGYVVCETCSATACPRCARVREQGFFCLICSEQV